MVDGNVQAKVGMFPVADTPRIPRNTKAGTMKVTPNVKVTPELAAEWLAHNTDNYRPLYGGSLSDYETDMTEGDWGNDIMPIAFAGYLDGKGKNKAILLNGQHRLQAIVKSGTTVELIVVEGLKSEDALTMDIGRKRSLDQQLRHDGYAYPVPLAAVLRLVYRYDYNGLKGRAPASNAKLRRYLTKYPEIVDSVPPATRLMHRIGGMGSVFGAGHHIISRIDEPDILESLDEFYDNAGNKDLRGSDPRLVYGMQILRQKGTNVSRRRMDQKTQLALLFKAWNAWRSGTEVMSFAWRGGGKTPEAFPTPE